METKETAADTGETVIIGALGLNQYTETRYTYGASAAETTPLVQEALLQFFAPAEYRVLLTPDVRDPAAAAARLKRPVPDNIGDLRRRAGERLKEVAIPAGQSINHLWECFEALVGAVPEDGRRVVLDVTNAFRSLPILTLAAAVYLQETGAVSLDGIVYGQYEVGAPQTPVVDLKPFLDLIAWAQAVRVLTQTGRGDLFFARVREVSGGGGTPLGRLGKAVQEMCDALQMNRPVRAITAARTLLERLKAVDPASLTGAAGPVRPLLDSIRDAFAPLALPAGVEDPFSPEGMGAQVAIARWCLDRKLYLQAIALTREWYVSCVTRDISSSPLDAAARSEAERFLNENVRCLEERRPLRHPLRGGEELARRWQQARDTRNDLLHCGMTGSDRKAETAARNVAACVADLESYYAYRVGKTSAL